MLIISQNSKKQIFKVIEINKDKFKSKLASTNNVGKVGKINGMVPKLEEEIEKDKKITDYNISNQNQEQSDFLEINGTFNGSGMTTR